MQLGRRAFIGGTIALTTVLAGCNDSGDGGDGGGGSNGGGGGNSGNDEQTMTLADARREIEEDDYVFWDFSVPSSGTVQYDYIVREGPDIELWVMPSDEFNHYQAEERFQYNGGGSGASDRGSVSLAGGDYVLVLDNTNMGSVSPPANLANDIASVEIDATVTY